MFDTIEIGGGDSYHSHQHDVEVNEHRAVTDESVKLLREMERKAQESIIKVILVKNNLIEGLVFYCGNEFVYRGNYIVITFVINGYQYVSEKIPFRTLKEERHEDKDMYAVADAFRKEVVEHLATSLFGSDQFRDVVLPVFEGRHGGHIIPCTNCGR